MPKGVYDRAPRVASRPAILRTLKPGESALFEAGPRGASVLMQQISADALRNDVPISQELVLGINVASRTIAEIVRVTRKTG